MNLYQIESRYQQLLDQEELTLEECQELDGLYDNIEDAYINHGKYILNKQAELAAVTVARQQMQERETALKDKIAKIERRLADSMLKSGHVKITKSPLFILQAKQNPLSVDVSDAKLIAENYWVDMTIKTVKRIDKNAIKAAIESGIEVEGARLVRTTRVEFK